MNAICTISSGATFKKEDACYIENQGIRILRGGNIQPFKLCIKPDDIFISKKKVKENILLKRNDIITPAVTSLENIGKMARIEMDMHNTTVGGFVFIIRPIVSSTTLSKFLLSFLNSPYAIEFTKSITNKSGQAFYNIGKERLITMLVPIPPLKEQERIYNQIMEILVRLRYN